MRPHFIAVYKPEHEWAGLPVERGRRCECGRWFPQQVVSPVWLATVEEVRRAALLEICEVVEYSKGSAAWFPKLCHRCERKAVEAEHVKARYA